MSDLDNAYASFKAAFAQGRAVLATHTHVIQGTYNATLGTTTDTTTDSECLVILDATRLGEIGFKFGEALVQTGDLLAIVAAKGLDYAPVPGDTLTVSEWPYRIVDVRPVFSGATPVLFNLLVRK